MNEAERVLEYICKLEQENARYKQAAIDVRLIAERLRAEYRNNLEALAAQAASNILAVIQSLP